MPRILGSSPSPALRFFFSLDRRSGDASGWHLDKSQDTWCVDLSKKTHWSSQSLLHCLMLLASISRCYRTILEYELDWYYSRFPCVIHHNVAIFSRKTLRYYLDTVRFHMHQLQRSLAAHLFSLTCSLSDATHHLIHLQRFPPLPSKNVIFSSSPHTKTLLKGAVLLPTHAGAKGQFSSVATNGYHLFFKITIPIFCNLVDMLDLGTCGTISVVLQWWQ